MDFRFAGESAAARACPPFDAPSFDSATAAGFEKSKLDHYLTPAVRVHFRVGPLLVKRVVQVFLDLVG
jgi:hypothetical protein